ncbi:MAG: FHA domain-containing protein [Myxococcales bacterium]|nr:FHA domain-containing protein [Myxococcales bacterium]
MSASTWWLKGESSLAKRITPAGLVVGRSPHCDVVLRSEQASRRHALVYLDTRGPRLVPLGTNPTIVNGEPVASDRELVEGDSLDLYGTTLEVAKQPGERVSPAAGTPVWVLEGPGGGLFGMAHSPFLVGGSPEDDLHVEGWPDGALCFRARDGGLEVEVSVPVSIGSTELDAGESAMMRRGQAISIGDSSVRVVTGGELASGSTASLERSDKVTHARLEFLPRGGRLHLTLAGEEHSIYLTDRRCDLIAVLLQPPEPFAAGDAIEDDVVLSRVWGKKRVDRTHLNVLLHRVRKDLSRIGLDGPALIVRTEGGGATRFVLAHGAEVVLE